MSPTSVDIAWRNRHVTIDYQWVNERNNESSHHDSLMVFLHEGLGSSAMWKDFPLRLCEALGMTGLVFSRPAYGRSTPRQADERWQPDFMHQQAFEVLPNLLTKLGITNPVWLFGHSDGGSIALLYASRMAVAGLIVVAPHIMVEDVTITSIAQAKAAYLTSDLRQRLARYHDDVDSAFWGWNDIWLNPDFRAWNIGQELSHIPTSTPILAMQGLDDHYGSLEQIRGIKRILPQTKLCEIPACGHSPHRDQPEFLIDRCARFILSAS